MGAFHSGALTVLITLNHLYPMTRAKTRIFGLLPVRDTSFTAVVGHLGARVLLGNCKAIVGHAKILEYKVGKHLISKDE